MSVYASRASSIDRANARRNAIARALDLSLVPVFFILFRRVRSAARQTADKKIDRSEQRRRKILSTNDRHRLRSIYPSLSHSLPLLLLLLRPPLSSFLPLSLSFLFQSRAAGASCSGALWTVFSLCSFFFNAATRALVPRARRRNKKSVKDLDMHHESIDSGANIATFARREFPLFPLPAVNHMTASRTRTTNNGREIARRRRGGFIEFSAETHVLQTYVCVYVRLCRARILHGKL